MSGGGQKNLHAGTERFQVVAHDAFQCLEHIVSGAMAVVECRAWIMPEHPRIAHEQIGRSRIQQDEKPVLNQESCRIRTSREVPDCRGGRCPEDSYAPFAPSCRM